ncbi:MAG: type IV toxin-antitoxin system AbiEi family antitoxin [Gammaproteobacteria bacterium]
MNRQNGNKLNQLLTNWPPGTVAVQPWLNEQEIYRQLADAYCKSGWLERLGRGAFVRRGDKVDWLGALYALQTRLGLSIHPGAQTALAMRGLAHYLMLGKNQTVILFGAPKETLPGWFSEGPWQEKFICVNTGLFENAGPSGLTQYKRDNYSITISAPERAMMELIYLFPKYVVAEDLDVAMESMATLRPKLVQQLLESCQSVKVKRYFMWLAEYHQHGWLKKLDISKINFGSGKRVFIKGGRLDGKYQITVPLDKNREKD